MTQRVAMTKCVGDCLQVMDRIMTCADHLERMAVFYGYSGVGKSTAASMAANHTRAFYVQCRSTFRQTDFCRAVLKEMGIAPAKNLTAMTDQIAEELVLSRRPLIIDEFDFMVKKRTIEIVRDIYTGSHAPILLIGEQDLPKKLKQVEWERFYGRVLVWQEAKGIERSDIAELAHIYAPGIEFAGDLQAEIYEKSGGSARLASTNIDNIREFCVRRNLRQISKSEYPHPIASGNGPRRLAA